MLRIFSFVIAVVLLVILLVGYAYADGLPANVTMMKVRPQGDLVISSSSKGLVNPITGGKSSQVWERHMVSQARVPSPAKCEKVRTELKATFGAQGTPFEVYLASLNIAMNVDGMNAAKKYAAFSGLLSPSLHPCLFLSVKTDGEAVLVLRTGGNDYLMVNELSETRLITWRHLRIVGEASDFHHIVVEDDQGFLITNNFVLGS
jgi:hypothetical protein